jgi:gas vesicle protein
MPKVLAPISFGLGLIIGAGASVLYAPHSGKITRNKIKNKYDEQLENLNEKLIETRDMANNLKSKISTT